jgi:hypothetical protein
MKFLAPIFLFGIAFRTVIAVEDVFPMIICENDKAPPGACANIIASIYPPVATALNDELKAEGLAVDDVYIADYDANIALIDADGGNRALRGGNGRELGYCPPYCQGSSSPFCMQICSGGRRRSLKLADKQSCQELAKASEVRLFELGKAIQRDDKVCAAVLKTARCSCSTL